MSSENRSVCEREVNDAATQNPAEFAVLQECLIGGDAEQLRRERRLRRRSLAISTLLQAVAVLAIVAIPFLGKVERIAMANVTPIPPYHARGVVHERPATPAPRLGQRLTFCLLCPPVHPTNPRPGGDDRSAAGTEGLDAGDGLGEGPGDPCSAGCINLGDNKAPRRPEDPTGRPVVVHVTHLDPAMLLERIEPLYPPLAKQIRRSGRVELRAMISADGRIDSLQVVSGDVLFYQSALDAVRQWRYRPTMLNGQAVKVDTYITVIYTLE
jgi:protein TonB